MSGSEDGGKGDDNGDDDTLLERHKFTHDPFWGVDNRGRCLYVRGGNGKSLLFLSQIFCEPKSSL